MAVADFRSFEALLASCNEYALAEHGSDSKRELVSRMAHVLDSLMPLIKPLVGSIPYAGDAVCACTVVIKLERTRKEQSQYIVTLCLVMINMLAALRHFGPILKIPAGQYPADLSSETAAMSVSIQNFGACVDAYYYTRYSSKVVRFILSRGIKRRLQSYVKTFREHEQKVSLLLTSHNAAKLEQVYLATEQILRKLQDAERDGDGHDAVCKDPKLTNLVALALSDERHVSSSTYTKSKEDVDEVMGQLQCSLGEREVEILRLIFPIEPALIENAVAQALGDPGCRLPVSHPQRLSTPEVPESPSAQLWDISTDPGLVVRSPTPLTDTNDHVITVASGAAKTPCCQEIAQSRLPPQSPENSSPTFTFHDARVRVCLAPAEPVASGAVGCVYRAELFTANFDAIVALKVQPKNDPRFDGRLLAREMKAWTSLCHKHVLPFYGSFDFSRDKIALVSPYMQNGTMNKYLREHPSANKPLLIAQVLEGVQYLHEEARIVHGDLKCENVLISDDGSALLSDFGLSTTVEAIPNMVTCTGIRNCNTLQFAAPELLFSDEGSDAVPTKMRSKTIASDVYALGMLIYQAYNGAPPWHRSSVMQLAILIQAGAGPPRTKDSLGDFIIPDAMWTICSSMWTSRPSERPAVTKILSEVRALLPL